MPQGKVGEDQRATGRYRLRLANHIPRRCQLSELPSEALLQVAVVSARHAGRKDRITRPELQGEAAPAQDAFRPKPEAWTPCKQRHALAERPSIQPGVVKQRERVPRVPTWRPRYQTVRCPCRSVLATSLGGPGPA